MILIKKVLPVTILLCLIGCGAENENKNKPNNHPILSQTTLEGIWYSRDYGEIKLIEAQQVTSLQVTNNACFPTFTLDPYSLINANSELINDSLIYNRPSDSTSVKYRRLYDINEVCTAGMTPSLDDGDSYSFDAQQVFSSFWHDMNTHYAFFKQRDVNWAQVYSDYYDALGGASEDGLKKVFSEILAQLNDGHTSITVGASLDSDDISFTEKPELRVQLHTEAVELGLDFEQQQQYVISQQELIIKNISEYLTDESKVTFLNRHNSNLINEEHMINWGIIEKNGQRTGYLAFDGFMNFYEREGIEWADIAPSNIKFNQLMEQIFKQLANTERLILDIRNNGGGLDMQGLQLVRRFLSEEITAWNISAFYQGNLYFQDKVKAQPHSGRRYLKPVSVLISSGTFSAAETFSMVMQNLPQVTMIGEATGGGTSDTMSRLLPNHWWFGLSNEYYQDSEGENFEVRGVQPDINVSAYDIELRAQGRDSAIEAALNL
ncbi:S41 family peptidase [Shewanella sp. VB17]|uniref:S41 family peptidase n=1 Tax=Shewanella sp. VB17 TaxID=2739432 RepID=UPI0015641BCC|nr:S41 family peptidase [Shewanella sp. VB17]NRD75112.1 S41 family peptidase [Shewanella sp. VB17]